MLLESLNIPLSNGGWFYGKKSTTGKGNMENSNLKAVIDKISIFHENGLIFHMLKNHNWKLIDQQLLP